MSEFAAQQGPAGAHIEVPRVSDSLTSKPPAFGTHSVWVVHDTDGTDCTMYQGGPGLFTPIELITFMTAVHDLVTSTGSSRGSDGARSAVLIRPPGDDDPRCRYEYAKERAPDVGPVALELWYRFRELLTSHDAFVKKSKSKMAYKWELWCRGKLGIAFSAYDRSGAPDPAFDFDRAAPEDLIEALTARDKLKNLFKL